MSFEEGSKYFQAFYAAYPLKKAPRIALRAWEKAVKGNDEELLAGDIMRGLEAQKLYRKKAASLKEFIPQWKHPSVWLNGGCWMEEIGSHSELLQKHEKQELGKCFCGEPVYGSRFAVCEHHLSFSKQGKLISPYADELRAMHHKLKIDPKKGREALEIAKTLIRG